MIFTPYYITESNVHKYRADRERKWLEGGLCMNCARPVSWFHYLYCHKCTRELYMNGLGDVIKLKEVKEANHQINMSLHYNVIGCYPRVEHRGTKGNRIHITKLKLDFDALASRTYRILTNRRGLPPKDTHHQWLVEELVKLKKSTLRTIVFDIMSYYWYYHCNTEQKFTHLANFHSNLYGMIMTQTEYRYRKLSGNYHFATEYMERHSIKKTMQKPTYMLRYRKPFKYLYWITSQLDKVYLPYITKIKAM